LEDKIKIKVPESKPKGLKREKNRAQTLNTIENLPTNKQVLRETLNPKNNQTQLK